MMANAFVPIRIMSQKVKTTQECIDGDFSLVGYISTNDDFFKSTKNTDEEYNEQPTFITYSIGEYCDRT